MPPQALDVKSSKLHIYDSNVGICYKAIDYDLLFYTLYNDHDINSNTSNDNNNDTSNNNTNNGNDTSLASLVFTNKTRRSTSRARSSHID